MNAKERLVEAQAALESRGAKDVKFCFSNLSEKPLSQVANEVADALEAVVSGNSTTLPAIGDLQTA